MAVCRGLCCGRRLRSITSRSCPRSRNRCSHKYPVGRLIPNSAHSAFIFSFPLCARLTNFNFSSLTFLAFQVNFASLRLYLDQLRCKGCPETVCKGCHETVHTSACRVRTLANARLTLTYSSRSHECEHA